MSALLKLECIGYVPMPPTALERRLIRAIGGMPAARAWCAEIAGTDPKYTYARRFLKPQYDYEHANSVGSRGVYAFYILAEGGIYEVSSPQSWQRTDRYFCVVENNKIRRISEQEVTQCLSDRSASTC